jgi:RNA polymerase sigma-70 factor (ECF subfamily)
MDMQSTEPSETAIHQAWTAGDLDAAATMALQLYRAEMSSFLVWRLRSPSDGQEAFSMLAEDLWSGMPRFEWRCTVRTWMYVLARNAAARLMASAHKRLERQVSQTASERLPEIVDADRTRTQIHCRTNVKERVRALRDQLDPDDQLVLALRVDRGLSWRELALAMNGDESLNEELLKREAARLRQCFQRIKQELRRMAAEQGLFSGE